MSSAVRLPPAHRARDAPARDRALGPRTVSAVPSQRNASIDDAPPVGRADLSTVADVDRLRVALIRIGRRIRTQARGDVSPSQLAVLGTIINHGPLGNGQIADHEHVRPSTSSKIVDTLERAGLVERAPDPQDRRCVLVSATDAGLAYADEVRAAGRTWLAGQLESLEAADVEAIERAVPALEHLLLDEPD